MTFYTIYDFELGFDGGTVEISKDFEHEWTIVEPSITGYPLLSRENTSSCIGGGVPCFTGNFMDHWMKYTIDLSEYKGKPVALSFLFGSDSNKKGEGWFIDQIEIWRNSECIDADPLIKDPVVTCKTDKKVYRKGDSMEAILHFQNPTTEKVGINVYSALLKDEIIFFWNGRNFETSPIPFAKELQANSNSTESLFIFPITSDEIKGNFILASAITKPHSSELYSDVSTYQFTIN